MDAERDRLVQVKGEDTHNGLCVNDVTAGDEIKIGIELGNVVYEVLDLVDGVQTDSNSFNSIAPFMYSVLSVIMIESKVNRPNAK